MTDKINKNQKFTPVWCKVVGYPYGAGGPPRRRFHFLGGEQQLNN
jgi:hypothetical protein